MKNHYFAEITEDGEKYKRKSINNGFAEDKP